MVVYHVTSAKKLDRYIKSGRIIAPVRAWESIEEAERFSKSTGRRVILRLRFPKNAARLEGHFGKAFVLHSDFPFKGF